MKTMKTKLFFFCILIAFFSLNVSVVAHSSQVTGDTTFIPIGEWGSGIYRDVCVRGNTAYCAAAFNGVDIVDFSNPDQPRKLGHYPSTYETQGVYVRDNFLYVADGKNGLQILNVVNPRRPIAIAHVPLPREARALYIKRYHLYVASYNRVYVIDIRSPYAPQLVATIEVNGDPFNLYATGNYLYVGTGMYSYSMEISGLHIYDILQPTAPQFVGVYDNGYNCPVKGVYVKDNYAYLAEEGLVIVDVSDPTEPFYVGRCGTSGSSDLNYYIYKNGVHVRGNRAYTASGEHGLQVYDITDKYNPKPIGNFALPGSNAYEFHVKRGFVCVAFGRSGLQIVDITNSESPVLRGKVDCSGTPTGIFIDGNYAYLTLFRKGLQVFDVSNPSIPVHLGNSKTTWSYSDRVTKSGQLAVVADRYYGIDILDVHDPSSPQVIGSYSIDPYIGVRDVALSGNYAYVAYSYEGLHIVDISDPTHPVCVGKYTDGLEAEGVVVSGDIAYVTDWDRKFRIFNISDPSNPTLMGVIDTAGIAEGVVIKNDYAYVSVWKEGVDVIDVSDPAHPQRVGGYAYDKHNGRIFLEDDYIFVTGEEGEDNGLLVLDISRPTNPVLVGLCHASGNVVDVFVKGKTIYIADSSGKMVIYRMHRAGNLLIRK